MAGQYGQQPMMTSEPEIQMQPMGVGQPPMQPMGTQYGGQQQQIVMVQPQQNNLGASPAAVPPSSSLRISQHCRRETR
jgi:hypothetical protein